MRILPEFITAEEEKQLHEEIEPYMSRMRYEFDHWDDVSIEAKRKIGPLRSKAFHSITGHTWFQGNGTKEMVS